MHKSVHWTELAIAGGRGKEKAPCRYLHYEIDFDPGDAGAEVKKDDKPKKKPYRLPIGLGPTGKIGEMVCLSFVSHFPYR